MGPLARVLVRKAAKTAPDLPALCQLLDVALSESQRAAFRRRLGNVGGAPPAPPPSPARPPATAPPAGAPPGRPLSPEVLAEAEERLAAHIGPVAKLLVKRAAKQASSSKDLYERLVAHIDDPQARRRFTAAIEELSGS
jgi:serine/threonine-protein kinase